MSILTPAAFFAIAAACAPGIDARMLLVQAQRESKLETTAVNDRNTDGTTDYGLMQINSGNFLLLGIRSPAEALEPCRNLKAAADLYKTLSRYNSGTPTASLAYAKAIIDATARLAQQAPTEPTAPTVPAAEVPRLEDAPGEPETLTGEN